MTGLDVEQTIEQTIEQAEALLPAWFVRRMMNDTWSFGLCLADGSILAISTILNVTRDATGALWLDVEMQLDEQMHYSIAGRAAPTTRTTASVAVAHVMFAMELADT